METTTADPYFVCMECAHTWSAPEASRCEYCHAFAIEEYETLDEAEAESDRIVEATHA